MLTRHPAMASRARRGNAPASRNLRPRRRLSARVVIPRSTSSNIVGGTLPGPCGRNVVDFAVVVIVIVTGPVVVTVAGLKLQPAPAGRPVQAKLIAPSPEPLAVTLSVVVTVPPTVTLALLVCAASTSAATVCVGSLAVSLAVFDSPPPETVALGVSDAGALFATSAVSVMSSKLVPANRVSPRVHCNGLRLQFQLGPPRAAAVSPAGKAISAVINVEVSAAPGLET